MVLCFETHGVDHAEAGDGPQPPHGRLRLPDFLDNSVVPHTPGQSLKTPHRDRSSPESG